MLTLLVTRMTASHTQATTLLSFTYLPTFLYHPFDFLYHLFDIDHITTRNMVTTRSATAPPEPATDTAIVQPNAVQPTAEQSIAVKTATSTPFARPLQPAPDEQLINAQLNVQQEQPNLFLLGGVRFISRGCLVLIILQTFSRRHFLHQGWTFYPMSSCIREHEPSDTAQSDSKLAIHHNRTARHPISHHHADFRM